MPICVALWRGRDCSPVDWTEKETLATKRQRRNKIPPKMKETVSGHYKEVVCLATSIFSISAAKLRIQNMTWKNTTCTQRSANLCVAVTDYQHTTTPGPLDTLDTNEIVLPFGPQWSNTLNTVAEVLLDQPTTVTCFHDFACFALFVPAALQYQQ